MKTIFNKLKKSILFYAVLYIFILFISKQILNHFNMEFIGWIYMVSFIIIFLGILSSVIQFGIKLELSKLMRTIFIIAVSVIITIVFLFLGICFLYSDLNTGVTKKDNDKVVCRWKGLLLHGTYYYYEYKNFMIRGTVLIDEESY